MKSEQYTEQNDPPQPAEPSQFDVTQPARPVRPNDAESGRPAHLTSAPPAARSHFDLTQPTPPLRYDLTRPAQPVRAGVAPRSRPVRRPRPQRPRADRRRASSPRRVPRAARGRSRRRSRGRLLLKLALAMTVCLAGLLAFGLLLISSPTNVLILGIDRRPGEGDAVRTDTILMLQADPGRRRLVLLSIPRDLWVTIPGRGEERINAAHVYGELDAAGGGPARVAETIGQNFGVPVHRNLRMDFDAFREVIDAAGGINVEVPAPIVDDAYPTNDYGTVRIEIPAGLQHMDGETALQYARSRHSSSDFDRAARQQQIFVALAKKLARPSGWFLIPRVYRAFQDAVDTDLTFRDLARLMLAWQRASGDKIEQIVIDRELTTPFRTTQGSDVLLPRWDLIRPLVRTWFAP